MAKADNNPDFHIQQIPILSWQRPEATELPRIHAPLNVVGGPDEYGKFVLDCKRL